MDRRQPWSTWSWTRAAKESSAEEAQHGRNQRPFSHAEAQRRKVRTKSFLCTFAPESLLERQAFLQRRAGPELPLQRAFIGPLDLNAKFLELAVKRGPRETKNLCAFLYVTAGALKGLLDRFTLNLRHRHQWGNNKCRASEARAMKLLR